MSLPLNTAVCLSPRPSADAPHELVPVACDAEGLDQFVTLRFYQEEGNPDVFLWSHNGLGVDLKYWIFARVPGATAYGYTTSCPVVAGIGSLEHWPFQLEELQIPMIRVVDVHADKIPCE